jgi:hypothetical protein
MRYVVHGEIKNAHKILVGNLKRGDHFEDLSLNNIRNVIKETGWEVVGWIHLAQDRDEWWA